MSSPILLGNFYPESSYSFGKLLSLLRRNPYPSTDIAYQEAYWRLLKFQNGTALIRVTSQGTIHAPNLKVELILKVGDLNHEALFEQVKHIMGKKIDRGIFLKKSQRIKVYGR